MHGKNLEAGITGNIFPRVMYIKKEYFAEIILIIYIMCSLIWGVFVF